MRSYIDNQQVTQGEAHSIQRKADGMDSMTAWTGGRTDGRTGGGR